MQTFLKTIALFSMLMQINLFAAKYNPNSKAHQDEYNLKVFTFNLVKQLEELRSKTPKGCTFCYEAAIEALTHPDEVDSETPYYIPVE